QVLAPSLEALLRCRRTCLRPRLEAISTADDVASRRRALVIVGRVEPLRSRTAGRELGKAALLEMLQHLAAGRRVLLGRRDRSEVALGAAGAALLVGGAIGTRPSSAAIGATIERQLLFLLLRVLFHRRTKPPRLKCGSRSARLPGVPPLT